MMEYFVNEAKKTVVATTTITLANSQRRVISGKAVCSPDDVFCEKTGKTIAQQRMLAAKERFEAQILRGHAIDELYDENPARAQRCIEQAIALKASASSRIRRVRARYSNPQEEAVESNG